MPPRHSLRLIIVLATVLCGRVAAAHDFERTQVVLTFARDGSFVLDVTNDAAWLEHRLIPFGPADRQTFADRVVLFVDGHEVRPTSVEFVTGPPPLATHRLRGRVPATAQSLRWYYGLPIDAYPLTIRRADGRIVVDEVAGDAWSRPIDLSGQFAVPWIGTRAAVVAIGALLLIPIVLRAGWRGEPRRRRSSLPL
jgi:hypothetical protein